MKLYELAEEYRADVAKLQDCDLPPEVVLDTIDGMQGEPVEKIKAVVIVAMEADALGDVRIEHGKRMVDSGMALKNRAAGLRSYAQVWIQNCGFMLPLKYPEFSINLQKNPPSCEVKSAELLPDDMKATEVTFRVIGDASELIALVNANAASLTHARIAETTSVVTVDKRAVLAALKEIKAANDAKAKDETPDRLPGAYLNPTSYRLAVK